MDMQTYRVIVEGSVSAGFERSQVLRNLASLFKQDARMVGTLLSGSAKVVKRGLNQETALRYQQAIEKAGAISRIEREQKEPTASTGLEQPMEGTSNNLLPEHLVCPRCGYAPSRPDDVLLLRGDCPRCGLLVKKDTQMVDTTLSESAAESDTDSPWAGLYEEHEAASWERRAYATTYTFSMFLVVYCVLVLAFIFLFYPLERLHVHVARDFLDIARADYPMLVTVLSILVVSFALPLIIGGHSWGQKKFGIRVQFTAEAGTGGIVLALVFRVAAIILFSYAPGLIVLRIANALGLEGRIPSPLATMIVMALLVWCAVWLVGPLRADKRGLLDLAAGSVQTEEGLVPLNPLRTALEPLAAVGGFLLVVGLILPLFFR